MKFCIKILMILFLFLILLFVSTNIFVSIKGKAILTEQLKNRFARQVSIGYLGLKIPLALEIKDLHIDGLTEIEYVHAYPSLIGLIGGKIILNKINILKPEIYLERMLSVDADEVKNVNQINIEEALTQTKEILNSPTVNNSRPMPIIIKHLRLKDGTINFVDRTIDKSAIEITLKGVMLNLDNLYLLPKSAISNFQLTARIPWQEGMDEGTVYASGWFNLYEKDMQARLEIVGIDGVYLYPYYYQWVDLENSRIEKANLSFISDILGQSNDVVAKCRLELTDIKFRPRPLDQPEHKAEKITTTVLGIFRALNQGRVLLNFTIRTKMDKPEFRFDSIGSAVDKTISEAIESNKVKIADVALLPAKFFEGITKGATGATKAIIEGTLSVGKSLKETILDTVKTEEGSAEAETQGNNLFKD